MLVPKEHCHSPSFPRPTCSRCQNLRTECQYEAEEGESRWSALRRRNQLLEAERDQLRELLAFVQMRPEPEALDIFARIRQTPYDDLFLLLRQIKDGALTMAGALAPYPGAPPPASMSPAGSTTAPDHRLPLPPIQSILNVGGNSSNRDMQPASLVHSQSLSSEDSRGSHGSMDGNIGSVTPHPHNHRLLDTLEPSLRGNANNPPTLATPQLTLSSEESTGSVNSTSMDAPPKPYHTP